jgi:hypothetical protein
VIRRDVRWAIAAVLAGTPIAASLGAIAAVAEYASPDATPYRSAIILPAVTQAPTIPAPREPVRAERVVVQGTVTPTPQRRTQRPVRTTAPVPASAVASTSSVPTTTPAEAPPSSRSGAPPASGVVSP